MGYVWKVYRRLDCRSRSLGGLLVAERANDDDERTARAFNDCLSHGT